MNELIKQLEFDDKFSRVMAELFDSPDGLYEYLNRDNKK